MIRYIRKIDIYNHIKKLIFCIMYLIDSSSCTLKIPFFPCQLCTTLRGHGLIHVLSFRFNLSKNIQMLYKKLHRKNSVRTAEYIRSKIWSLNLHNRIFLLIHLKKISECEFLISECNV